MIMFQGVKEDKMDELRQQYYERSKKAKETGDFKITLEEIHDQIDKYATKYEKNTERLWPFARFYFQYIVTNMKCEDVSTLRIL